MHKVALVTGGSMGLGLAIADHFMKIGYDVVTCARSGEVTWECDVGNERDVDELFGRLWRAYGRLDVLVNNAAIYGPVGQIDEGNSADWEEVIAVNLLGPYYCCRHALPMMRRQGYGKIINISGAGARPQKECTAYNASKAGLIRFTEALAKDLEDTGIDVNSLAPGTLDTRMRLRSAKPEDPEGAMRAAVAAVAWLASSESDGISGRLFSAVWDDFGNLPAPLGRDDFMMRRVVP